MLDKDEFGGDLKGFDPYRFDVPKEEEDLEKTRRGPKIITTFEGGS